MINTRRQRFVRLIVALGLVSPTAPSSLAGQPTDTIAVRTRYSIDFVLPTHPARFERSGGPLYYGAGGYVTRAQWSPNAVLVQGLSADSLLELYHPGEGPGEFSGMVTAAAATSDEVIVADQSRLHTFSLEGSLRRTIQLGTRSWKIVPGGDGSWLVNTLASDLSSAVLHCKDADCRPLPLSRGTVLFRGVNEFAIHHIAVVPDVGIAVVQQGRYQIDIYDPTTLRLERTLVRAGLFPPASEGFDPRRPQHRSEVRAVKAIGGLLWVFFDQIDEPSTASVPIPSAERWQRYDAVVEVIDLKTGSVVARRSDRDGPEFGQIGDDGLALAFHPEGLWYQGVLTLYPQRGR